MSDSTLPTVDDKVKNIASNLETKLKIFTIQAQKYRNEIDTAKTGYKKEYFQKKLDKVTKKVVQLLILMKDVKSGINNG